ncbi:MAG: DNRLRE domain-containing protein [Desulfitobacteriaceae bacterium]|nr:DNRLRE domain-containing protein [Desulfitobacteriaceae bacterium]
MQKRFIKIIASAVACLILLVLAPLPAAARPDSTVRVNPSDDTSTIREDPDQNLGSNPILFVSCYGTARSYLKFSLPAILDNALIKSATLNLFHSGGHGLTGTSDVHRVSTDWSENTITWNNQPEHIATKTASLNFDPKDNGKWRSWDVTSDIDSTALTAGWVSWCIKSMYEGPEYSLYSWDFYSKERWDTTNIPYLEITYNTPPTLSSGSVTPTTGEWGTSFVYEITYTDADNDLPITYPRLFIDGEMTGKIMTEKDPTDMTVTDGKVYKYVLETTTENIGIHNFYFNVEDPAHGFSARYPPTGVQDGPTITKRSVNLTCVVDDETPEPGQQIIVSGYLKDSKGLALAQRTICLYMNGLDTGLTAVTDNSGFYSISIKAPENRESFSIDVRFTEETLYSSMQSSTVLVSTRTSEFPIVWIAAVVIVAVAISALVLVKKKK